MITGDNRRTAEAIATQLGIDSVTAEVLPDGKVAAIQALRQQFGTIAFVGDGIIDAPALAEADIGLAIGTGTDIAIEAADVVLMAGNLQGVPKAIALSKATIGNIRRTCSGPFAYNIALIPVAAGMPIPHSASAFAHLRGWRDGPVECFRRGETRCGCGSSSPDNHDPSASPDWGWPLS